MTWVNKLYGEIKFRRWSYEALISHKNKTSLKQICDVYSKYFEIFMKKNILKINPKICKIKVKS